MLRDEMRKGARRTLASFPFPALNPTQAHKVADLGRREDTLWYCFLEVAKIPANPW